MFDQKKEAMKFAINLAILKVVMLSDHANVFLRILIKERGIWRNTKVLTTLTNQY